MELHVTNEHDGVRLDRYLKSALPELPVSAFHRLLRKKKIRVNGKPTNDARCILHTGDTVRVEEAAPGSRQAGPKRAGLTIVFEDEVLLVIDKPCGMAVHSGKGEGGRTVIDLLRAGASTYEPYLVHRLDKYTSGVLVVAKDRRTAGQLGDVFQSEGGRDVRKRYLTVVFGEPRRAGRIDLPLDRKTALTRYRLLQEIHWSSGILTLLEAEIDTGRTHQIRRHLAAINLPVAGDDEYGDWELNKTFRAEFGVKHFLLHALELRLRHPVTGVPMRFNAPIPREFYLLFKDLSSADSPKHGGE
jgi:23S rRNA pseudouridine955/2504/2580 synthase